MSTDAIIVDPGIIYGVLVTMYFRRAAMFREEITSSSKRKLIKINVEKASYIHTYTYYIISEQVRSLLKSYCVSSLESEGLDNGYLPTNKPTV
jgi:hypothetical protein